MLGRLMPREGKFFDLFVAHAEHAMRAALSRLFREGNDVKEVVRLRLIYDRLESITDRCEDVANVLEGIVLESS